jgi:hypothetical protein
MRGELFETWVVSELIKYRFNKGKRSNLYFWRDKTGNEIDVLVDQGDKLFPIEIKSGQRVTKDYFKNLEKFTNLAGENAKNSALIYAGEKGQARETTKVVSWKAIDVFVG